MELENPKPRHGHGTYRIGDSDDLVLVENVTWIPSDKICLQDHGIIILCMAGKIRFEYANGVMIRTLSQPRAQ